MTTLKAWRNIAKPHQDILEGRFQQSEFAADLTRVANQTAPLEYNDAEQFFNRTYITDGMRQLLLSVVKRLGGKGGDPVIQLQTAFGGGKTHTMLAAYHLAKFEGPVKKLEGVSNIVDQAGITELPHSAVAILDGNDLSPSQGRKVGSYHINTLWGELAWQLLGADGYEIIRQSDESGTSPGKQLITQLLEKSAPCVILIDELTSFIRQLKDGDSTLPAGSLSTNLSFIQALTEAIRGVNTAILLASLPESEAEVGGEDGQRVLTALEKFFGRLETVWKPVSAEEAFHIVQRRLFDTTGSETARDEICKAFYDLYQSEKEDFPVESFESSYLQRLKLAYPIHPEVFDRLYEDWSTLEKFQRTRGVLQYMAIVIHKLWNDGNTDALIMPGSLPLSDQEVRTKSTHYLPQVWDPIIDKEIDGLRSIPKHLDGIKGHYGQYQAATRVARTLFLGTAPSNTNQASRGISTERIFLGSIQPGQQTGVFLDALHDLQDQLHYLYTEGDRQWFDTKPNLRQEMEQRREHLDIKSDVYPVLKKELSSSITKGESFSGVHIFTPSEDVPDDHLAGIRLVIVEPDIQLSYDGVNTEVLVDRLNSFVKQRGAQPRIFQNKLVFLVCSSEGRKRVLNQAKTMLAWQAIVADIEAGVLNHDMLHLNQAKSNASDAKRALERQLRDAWSYLAVPEQMPDTPTEVSWELFKVRQTANSFQKELENTLKEEEVVIYQWAPIHLYNEIAKWYFEKDVSSLSYLKLRDDFNQYLYFPRLLNEQILQSTAKRAVQEGKLALGVLDSNGEIERVIQRDFPQVNWSEKIVFITPDVAEKWLNSHTTQPTGVPTSSDTPTIPTREPESPTHNAVIGTETPDSEKKGPAIPKKKRFFGTVELDPIRAGIDFSTIMEEVVQHFSKQLNTSVRIRVDIEVETQNESGFSEQTQRIVSENSRSLNFNQSSFEE